MYRLYFAFSKGLSKPVTVSKGTYETCMRHVRVVEKTLGYESEQYLDNPRHWKTTIPAKGVPDDVFCDMAIEHNRFVRWLYSHFAECSEEPVGETEMLTPEQAADFWHGLEMIEVPIERWTNRYYIDRMEHLYAVMRGREDEGVSFDEEPLSPRQAAAVIRIFGFIDPGDHRLEVPRGHDHLASSDEYFWCENHGAVDWLDPASEACTNGECSAEEPVDANQD